MTSLKNVYSFPNGNTSDVQMCDVAVGEVAFFIAPSADASQERQNQDSLAIVELSDGSLVLAVADGAGAHRGGAEASRTAVTTLIDCLKKSNNNNQWKGVLLDAIDEANRAVIKLGLGAASTFVLTHINAQGIRPYQVGDSGALVVGQKGKLKFQTLSHSPVGYAVEAGMIDEETALQHEDRNIVSNMLGAEDMHMQIDNRVPLSPRDTVLLASDGLFDNLRTEEITTIMRKGKLEDSLKEIVQKVQERMLNPTEGDPSKADDISLIIFRGKSKKR